MFRGRPSRALGCMSACSILRPPSLVWATKFDMPHGLPLAGQSPLFGTVRVHLDPSQASYGEVGPADVGSLAAKCVAHCFPVVELPELGMRLTTAGSPVDLASKVVQIPPVGDVARSEN